MTTGRMRRKAKRGVKKDKRFFRIVICHETVLE